MQFQTTSSLVPHVAEVGCKGLNFCIEAFFSVYGLWVFCDGVLVSKNLFNLVTWTSAAGNLLSLFLFVAIGRVFEVPVLKLEMLYIFNLWIVCYSVFGWLWIVLVWLGLCFLLSVLWFFLLLFFWGFFAPFFFFLLFMTLFDYLLPKTLKTKQ